MSISKKWKQVILTIEKQLNAVKQDKNGEILCNITVGLGNGNKSTVSDLVKTKEKLGRHCLHLA